MVHFSVREKNIARVQSAKLVNGLRRDLMLNAIPDEMVASLHPMVSFLCIIVQHGMSHLHI
jgi:hypothetical protein